MSFLSIENLFFAYGKTRVVENFSLQVEEGSFTTLLGASGCGKTTLLRLVSGFLEPDSGTIKIDGKIINGILPNKRKIGFVFQDYALFPHLTVEQNLFYGLNLKKRTKETKNENKTLVMQTAENLGLQNLMNRFPSELSGGQQQRVALGRVLVLQPSLLLMDEPLSSLDTNLRLKVREELKEIQKKLKITTVYVTHDQEEALNLSDKIAVMKDGKLLQYGTPQQVYFEPKDSFTAEFVGQVNFVDGKMFRPEWLKISKNPVGSADFAGTVLGSEFLGAFTRYKIQLESQSQIITADEPTVSAEEIKIGDKVGISVLKKCDLPLQEK